VRTAAKLDGLRDGHPDPLRDPRRAVVLLVDDGDDAREVEVRESCVQAGSRSLGCVAAPPPVAPERVAELDVAGLPEDAESRVADDMPAGALDDGPELKPRLACSRA
jgi:hypothetical protein